MGKRRQEGDDLARIMAGGMACGGSGYLKQPLLSCNESARRKWGRVGLG